MKTKIETTKAHQAISSSPACHCGPPLLFLLLLLGWSASARVDAVADCAAPSFAAARWLDTIAYYPQSVTVADFNGDGKADRGLANVVTKTYTDTNDVGDGGSSIASALAPREEAATLES